MAELTIDTDMIQRAAATAIVTLLGEDKDKLVAGLVADVLAAPDRYNSKKTNFQNALESVLHNHVTAVIQAWLADNEAEVRAHIVGQIEAHKDEVLATVTEDMFKRLGWLGR